jgi:hypothetical protein
MTATLPPQTMTIMVKRASEWKLQERRSKGPLTVATDVVLVVVVAFTTNELVAGGHKPATVRKLATHIKKDDDYGLLRVISLSILVIT